MSLSLNLKYGDEDITSLNASQREIILDTQNNYCEQNINVKLSADEYEGKVLDSIYIDTLPKYTEYYVTEKLKLSGLTVKDNFGNDVTSLCSFNPDTSILLDTSHTLVEITYLNLHTSFPILVTQQDCLCITAVAAGSTVALSSGTWNTLETSTDNLNWNNYSAGTVITLNNIGDKVYWRGNSWINEYRGIRGQFTMTGTVDISGDVNSMLIYNKHYDSLPQACFIELFRECTSIRNASNLKLLARSTGSNGYRAMFAWCTNLISAPLILSQIIEPAGCGGMFLGCTSLAVAPSLPATTINGTSGYTGYSMMFLDCTSLVTIPSLPATNPYSNSYFQMFCGCSSLLMYATSGTGHDKAYRIPSSGTFTGNSGHTNMFSSTPGDVPDSPTFTEGQFVTYYTQNLPV